MSPSPAVFIDRDGVVVEDVGPISAPAQVELRGEAPAALRALKDAGFLLVTVTNQAVVARGLASESRVAEIQTTIEDRIARAGGPMLDGFYFCPHHPEASDPAYRWRCRCRKPGAGMLLRASEELGIDLERSFMVGDRLSDVEAGHRAGCRAILVETGRHVDPPIRGMQGSPTPDFACASLGAAASWILEAAA